MTVGNNQAVVVGVDFGRAAETFENEVEAAAREEVTA